MGFNSAFKGLKLLKIASIVECSYTPFLIGGLEPY